MKELELNDPRTLNDSRYALLGTLGEGSMGRTYLADDAVSGRQVAVKALYPSRLATVKDLELFTREATILQKLTHPRIPAYIDAFSVGEGEAACYYLVQTYVEGPTLRSRIQEGARWSEEEAIAFAIELLTLLDYMHGCSPAVVHRDIKPDNVILRDGTTPVLVDFGAVREVVRLTMGGGSTIIGTYGYMPPEQLMGAAVPASDIYSVGVTVLEMLTRQTPKDLRGEDVKRLISTANVSDGLRRVLSRMCSPSLKERYQNAGEVVGDLEGARGGGPLVHAERLETEISERKRAEDLALKKSSTPGLVHLGYVTLLGLIVSAAVGAIVMVIQTVGTSFGNGVLLAGGISAASMMICLGLLALRYTHDAWQPPGLDWTATTGRVTEIRDAFAVGHELNERAWLGWSVRYAFRTARGDHEHEFIVTDDAVKERCEIGRTFVVYYKTGNPEWHDLQDFAHDEDDAMARLFDRAKVHTPE